MLIDTLLYSNNFTSNTDPATRALIFGGIGAIFSLIGATLNDRRKRLVKEGVQVEGTVISIERERSSKNSMTLNYPVVSYRTLQNELMTKKYNIGISSGSSYKEGDSVNVIYDPKDTSSFMLNDASSKIIPRVFILIGLVLIIGAVIFYIMK
ncbi:DUF3592 domain-containing protein [Mucilaginibacter rubeus]|uniref:DUF3592 domain-containing protein n=1 Tax=Mucilaginibacter rubeus TaxID=2027860 RepID=A0AAE6MI33_9SPHI|nr:MULTISPECIES: DUF3592 domain-containing protein [Mucilaginibacter]QEM03874.1 DUF3592 domain-containing protein [Mucilaginibacter rubeus]QEM16484.1 DUF3592 domain-containing protein [Mucilaginibacter gossypii]QTE40748.1 DUF3592 domain-containing protein [Mucilaginibacter rubeus]QTE47350.1 DUF3592 domain-containing protein [Mucilaginibacter rubeus]QTE58743.1 DUF3592 domain-containing protein [Mucilaginibacter rubeus]